MKDHLPALERALTDTIGKLPNRAPFRPRLDRVVFWPSTRPDTLGEVHVTMIEDLNGTDATFELVYQVFASRHVWPLIPPGVTGGQHWSAHHAYLEAIQTWAFQN